MGSAWLHSLDSIPESARGRLAAMCADAGLTIETAARAGTGVGVLLFDRVDEGLLETLRACAGRAMVLAIATCATALRPAEMWGVLQAGAADLLHWPRWPADALQVVARLQRWAGVQALMESEAVKQALVGDSAPWRRFVRGVVEAGAYSQASVLITGESGTGKEEVARLIHALDPRPDKGELVVVDCTTITPELSGSEFFGHERGAFTGAVNAREGGFALAHKGTLFLDEIGELPLPLQAQLLRAIQERKYKRVGSNVWQHTDFRLVCATNRDLEAAVAEGNFRADLFYRIAAWRCRTPPLRERREDILPLAEHFFRRALFDEGAGDAEVQWDPAVREYLLARAYPGNVRDLRQTVLRIAHRHAGPGPVTLGDVPDDERPAATSPAESGSDPLEAAVRRAVEAGMGLKDITQAVSDLAMQTALDQEGGSVQRAAQRLGVTDRTVQLRRAAWRSAAPEADA